MSASGRGAAILVRGAEPPGATAKVDLGASGITETMIGSDPRCRVVLPGIAPIAARSFGASIHTYLEFFPPGTEFPLPPAPDMPTVEHLRVDQSEFRIGPYALRFVEEAGNP